MTYQYECPTCKATMEKFFRSISAGDAPQVCEKCGAPTKKQFSRILGFGLYGNPEGYAKPSACKRFNTKTVSQKEGNSSAIG